MKLSQKIRAALSIIRHSPGLSGKLSSFRNLSYAALHSKLARKFSPAAGKEDLTADFWAEYYLLTLVNRQINVQLIDRDEPFLVVIIPELDPTVIFGGYIAFFQFLAHLQARGVKISMFVMKVTMTPAQAVEAFRGNKLVHGVLEQAELHNLGVARTIRIGAGDAIICYNWTSAIFASRVAAFLPRPAWSYFVQEDERIFYPNDSYSFLAESVFLRDPKPDLVCNSSALLAHLRREGVVDPGCKVAVFEQGIPEAPLPEAGEIATRSPRRFIFYGRPEHHAKRNLMTIALMAMEKAIRAGAFDTGEPWEFYMMGSSRMGASFRLGEVVINCLPNSSYEVYRQRLAGFDVGLVLMYAPHPSVPPFEMVRSGVVTVVNTTPARSDEWYRGISANFEPALPSVEGIAEAIVRAVARCGDGAARVAAADTYHPQTWDQSFSGMTGSFGHPLLERVWAQPERNAKPRDA